MAILIGIAAIPAQAETFTYDISDMSGINEAATTAVVDTGKREIRLPKVMPNVIDFWDGSLDYVVVTPSGVKRMDTTAQALRDITTSGISNPIAVAACASMYPDIVVADKSSVTHYSFANNYLPNPTLSAGGFTDVISVGSSGVDVAVLDQDTVSYHVFDGSNMVYAPSLSVDNLANPIAMSMFTGGYGFVVVDDEGVKCYQNGSLFQTITDHKNVVAVSAADGRMALVADREIKYYNLAGGTLQYNSALSVTDGLTEPACVAVRPGSNDILIVDGDDIKYYMWDGSKLVYEPDLSVKIAGLQDMGKYLPKAVAESIIYSLTGDKLATHVKLWIDPKLDPQESETAIKWFVSSQEGDDKWIETELNKWVALPEPGKDLRWKAELTTTNRDHTPRINPVIVLQTNSKPNKPEIYEPTGCYLDSSPLIQWKYDDPDGDPQGGFQLLITKKTGETVLDTGKISTVSAEKFRYEIDPEGTGLLWETGTNEFSAKVKVWDTLSNSKGDEVEGVESEWSETIDFCVIAFDRPKIHFIETPLSLDRDIYKGMEADKLSVTKAGGLVEIYVYSIGVSSAYMEFPYLDSFAAIADPPATTPAWDGPVNKCWRVSFYTNANPDMVPTGTIVAGIFAGNGINRLLLLNADQPDYSTEPTPETANWWQWEGYRWWAEGIVRIEGTAFSNWSVILHGSKA